MNEQEKYDKLKDTLSDPPEGMGVKQHIEALIDGLPTAREAAKNEREFDQMVENEIKQDKVEELLKCYECGETIEDGDETYIEVSESPDEYVRAPFCPDCSNRIENA